MGRPKGSTKTPSYRLHKPSGQGITTIDGRAHYCGAFGTPEAQRKYERLIGEWMLRGRTSADTPKNGVTVTELCASYWPYMVKWWRAKSQHLHTLKSAMRFLRESDGDTPAGEFSPVALKAIRERMIRSRKRSQQYGEQPPQPMLCSGYQRLQIFGRSYHLGLPGSERAERRLKELYAEWDTRKQAQKDGAHLLSRRYVNILCQMIVAMFHWGTENELIPTGVADALNSIRPLVRGKCPCREPDRIKPVDDNHVEAVLPYLSPTLAAMVKLQRLTGARPGEICMMRTCDIDRSGDVWMYRPRKHKTEHHGYDRIIPIGPRAQEILNPLLRLDLTAPIFSPKESYEQRMEHRASLRKCSRDQRKGHEKILARMRDEFNTSTYGYAVSEGIIRANDARLKNDPNAKLIPHWHTNQLRHTAATELRARYGLEAASAQLGHMRPSTTLRYAEQDMSKATNAIREVG